MDPDDECAGADSFDCDTGTLDIGTLGNLKAQLAAKERYYARGSARPVHEEHHKLQISG